MAPPRKAPRDKKVMYTFWIAPAQLRGIKAVHARDGVLPSEQIRRAIDRWLKAKGIGKTALAPEKGGTRPKAK